LADSNPAGALIARARGALQAGGIAPAEPLCRLVPTRDTDGKRLIDFMMLVPKLRDRPEIYIQATFGHIQQVLGRHAEVVFADLNLRLNLLWVSLRHRPGVVIEIASAIRLRVPEAVLVAQNPHS
jgi:hypothetical protein